MASPLLVVVSTYGVSHQPRAGCGILRRRGAARERSRMSKLVLIRVAAMRRGRVGSVDRATIQARYTRADAQRPSRLPSRYSHITLPDGSLLNHELGQSGLA